MKKFILISLGILMALLLIIASVPLFFKDKIKAKLLADIDSKVDADVFFSDMGVSSLRNFPRMTLDLEDFYIVGKEKFAGDTLASAKTFSVTFDFYSVVNNKHKIEIKSIQLIDPRVHIKVLPDGSSNTHIMKADSSKAGNNSSFNIAIDHWVIKNGDISYDDQQQHTYLELSQVNHSGNGDFTQDVSDLNLATSVASLSYSLNGVRYLDRKKLSTDLNMEMNLKEYKFTFKDHVFDINHFKFGFEGYFKFLKHGYEIDIRVLANRSDFRDLLSLMPGFYIEDFKKMKVNGEFTLDAHAKGVYDLTGNLIPAFTLDLIVKEGSFKYNHLPKGAEHINMELLVENTSGVPGTTDFDLKNFEVSIDNVPVRGRLKMIGLGSGVMDGEISAKVDLAQIEKMYPVNGITLKGKLSADIKARGNYDLSDNKFPFVDARLVLNDGYVKTASYPVTMEKIHIDAEATNKTGNPADTEVDLHEMTYLLDGESFKMKGSVHNFVNYAYDLDVDGLIDLEKLMKLYPVAGVTATGTMDIDVESSGKLSALKSMNFDSLKSSGTVELKDIVLTTKAMVQPLKISSAKTTFTPKEIIIENFDGTVGKSDFSVTGHLYDYHSWVFQTGRNIRGDLALKSDTLDYNAMFPSPVAPATAPPASIAAVAPLNDTAKVASPAVISIPGQIDFTFDAKVGFIRFDQMKINDLVGEIKIKDGIMTMNETGFTSSDANFKINGTYDTRDIKHPMFDVVLDIDKLDFNKAFAMFETVQTAAPAAQNTDGVFSTKYHLKGELSPDFSPVLETLTGGGTIVIQDAQVKGMKMFSNVSGITKKQELADPHLKDITMETEIKGGKVFIKPFSFQIGKYFTELEGTQSFDNKMDYILKLSAPAFHKIKIPFRITGTSDKPVVKVGKGHEKFDFSGF